MRRTLAAIIVAVAWASPAPAVARPTPPPTPVPPHGSPSPFPSALHTPKPTARPPRISAGSAALINLDTGQVLLDRNGGKRRPIASTTKIMTALLVLERTSLDDTVTAGPAAVAQGGATLGLRLGEELRVRHLLYALMLQSANDAAVALAEHISASVPRFVELMNRRAERLGLRDTNFASPNGLDDRGYSTARDLAAITVAAFDEPGFARVVRTKFHTIPAPDGEPREIQNRNALLWLYRGAIGVKTGFTAAAGFSLVAGARKDGAELGAVVLGAPADAFSDAAALLNYGTEGFEVRTVVEVGELLDPVTIAGRSVPVSAGKDLEVLLPSRADIVRIVAVSRPAVPVEVGDRVGTITVRSAGYLLGRVALVAAGTPTSASPPPSFPPKAEPESSTSWWEAALENPLNPFVPLHALFS